MPAGQRLEAAYLPVIGGGEWSALAASTTSKVIIAMILLVVLMPLISRVLRLKKDKASAT